MRITIGVTAERIAAELREACDKCPVALGVNAVLADAYHAEVDELTIVIKRLSDEVPVCTLDAPAVVGEFVLRFDREETVEPLGFPLDIPSHLLRSNP
jgi:hypothetical protein